MNENVIAKEVVNAAKRTDFIFASLRLCVRPLPLAGLLLLTLFSAAALGAGGTRYSGSRPKALVLACEDGAATAQALREAGLDAAVASDEVLQQVALSDVRLVVMGADMELPDALTRRIATMVRGGGGLLAVHTTKDPNFWFDTYRRVTHGQPNPSPLWDVLAFTQVPIADQETGGIRNPFGPTRVLRQADSAVLAGVDLKQAPSFPLHGFMVLPTHPIVQGTHLMFGWSEDQYKSPLWGNGQVLAWGDDPEQRPLLLAAEYGAGRSMAAAVPLFNPAFLRWPGGKTLIHNLIQWLLGGQTEAVSGTLRVPLTVGTRSVPDTEVYGVGLPWIVRDSLGRMGFRVTSRAAGAAGAVVYAVPSAEQAAAVAALAKAGKPVVVADPKALKALPLGELAALRSDLPSGPVVHAAPPTPIVDARPLLKQKLVLGEAWAIDAGNVGKTQHWFTPEGAAQARWAVDPADLAKHAESKPAPATSQADIYWSKTYRWRLEGNLLDRRDFVEGWERPDYDDSAWAGQPLGQNPPSPKLLGRQTPGQNQLAGAVWARARLTLPNPQAAHQWLVPSEATKCVTLLDGKPLREPVELRKLAAGEHVVALRVWPFHTPGSDYDPWGRSPAELPWPTVAADPGSLGEPKLPGKLWYKAGVRLPADSPWNAIQIDEPSPALLYVNGTRISSAVTGIYCAPWHAGDNLLVWGSLQSEKIPSVHLAQVATRPAAVTVPAAQRLAGVWYRRDDPTHKAFAQGWLAALANPASSSSIDTPPAGWAPLAPNIEAGTVADVPDEQSHWFAAPFLVSKAEAQGPARMVIDTTGGAVPTDMIKTVWINGQPVQPRIEFASTQRYGVADLPAKGVKHAKTLAQAKHAGKQTKKGNRAKSGKNAKKSQSPTAVGSESSESPPPDQQSAAGDEATSGDEPANGEGLSIRSPEQNTPKQTIISFILSGKLKPGLNWLAFPVDLQNVYGMRMAVPAGMGWTVPYPKLDFSGRLDALVWAPPFAQLGGAGLVRRGPLAVPPADAEVLAQFSDGAPAIARVGSVIFATTDQSRDWSPWIDEAVRIDWTTSKTRLKEDILGPGNFKNANHVWADPVQADGAQIAAALLRGAPAILAAEPAAGGALVRLAPADRPRLSSYQLRNWMGMVLAEGRLAVPAQAQRVTVPPPHDDPSPLTTRLRADRWLRAALLENGGAVVRDYLEARVDPRPPVEVLLAPSDGLLRDLPKTIPGAPHYSPRNITWSLIAESPASPVVVPGEQIRLRVMCRNTTPLPQEVALDLDWKGAIDGKNVPLSALRFTLAPYQQRTEVVPCGFRVADMQFMPLSGNDAGPLRAIAAGQQPVGDMATGRIVATPNAGETRASPAVSDLALVAVRPWKQFAPYPERPPGQQGAPVMPNMLQFARTPSLESLASPPKLWSCPALYDGNYYSSVDWWRDHFLCTRGDGGGFDGYSGTDDFPWGPYDDVFGHRNNCLDNAGYLPDGVQYHEFLYASISREYNRFVKGTRPLYMEVADYWESSHTALRERNVTQFLRWRIEQGRPLEVDTVGQMKQLLQDDPRVAEDWRIFARDAYLAWGKQYMAGLPPDSINGSQGGSENYRFGRLHDSVEAFRSVLETHNSGFFQPANLRRRGELGFSAFRAVDPTFLLTDHMWHTTTGHSQTAGGAWGSSGSVYSTPEFAQMMYLDRGLMAIRDDQGRAQPTVNLPPSCFTPHPIPLFSTKTGYHLPADGLARDVTSHLDHLIQPERVLGAYVVPSLERVASDKLDGSTVKLGAYVTEKQPEVGLTHMLRNYGALWGGTVAPDRLNKLGPGEGAIYIMPSGAGDAEANPMADFVRRGGHLSVFFSTGGTKKHETALSTLFGIKYAPVNTNPPRTMRLRPDSPEQPYLAPIYGEPQYVSTGESSTTDIIKATGALVGRVLLRTVEAGKGRAVFSSMNANLSWGWDHDLARKLAQAVNWAAGNPITLPEGVGGSAFEAKGMTFVVLEDLKYTGGEVSVHVKMPNGNYVAADVFAGTSVPVTRVGDGLDLHVLLPPNGGSLIVLRTHCP